MGEMKNILTSLYEILRPNDHSEYLDEDRGILLKWISENSIPTFTLQFSKFYLKVEYGRLPSRCTV
jgi:hypothetical protein